MGYNSIDTHPTLKALTIPQDFCSKPRKRRRRVPEGTQGGVDEGLEQKDKKAAMILGLDEYEGIAAKLCGEAAVVPQRRAQGGWSYGGFIF